MAHKQTINSLQDQAREASTEATRYRDQVNPQGTPERNSLLQQIAVELDRKASQLRELAELFAHLTQPQPQENESSYFCKGIGRKQAGQQPAGKRP